MTDALTHLQVQGITTSDTSPSPALLSRQPRNEFEALLSDFPEVVQPCTTEQPVKHNVTHHITTTGPPVSARFRLNVSKQPDKSLNTCSSKESSVHHQVIGPHHCIWYRRRPLVTGDHVETTEPLIM